jgi:hypothetical protein
MTFGLGLVAGFVFCLLSVGLALAAYVFLWLRSQVLPADPTPRFALGFDFGTHVIEGIDLMSRINTEQRVLVSVNPLTVAGNPAAIDGDVVFLSSDESVARVDSVSATSAYVTAVGPGAAQIFVSFDADLGEGVRTIELSGAIEVVPAEAARGEIVFGDPELIPAQEGAGS